MKSVLFLLFISIAHYLMFYLGYGNLVVGLISIFAYITVNIQYLKINGTSNIFSFELLFAISFFLSCLIFAVLSLEKSEVYMFSLIGSDLGDSARWRFFNLSLFGYYVYMIGLKFGSKGNRKSFTPSKYVIKSNFLSLCNLLTTLAIVYFFIRGGNRLMNRYTGDVAAFTDFAGALFFVTVFYTISSMAIILKWSSQVKPAKSFFFHSAGLHYLINTALILPLLLFSGYRSQFMQYAIPVFFMYIMYVQRISNRKLLLYLVAGVFLMIFIGIVRVGDDVNGHSHDVTYFLRDFVLEDIAGIWLVDYTDSHGITGGSNAILQMVSFIPFMGGIVSTIIGPKNIAQASSLLFTYEYRSDGTGLGTNMVGDLYYTFGLAGVIICLFLLGVFIKKLSISKSIYGLLCYLLLLGNAIFSTRVEFFYIVRLLGFSIIILFFLIKITGNQEKSYINRNRFVL